MLGADCNDDVVLASPDGERRLPDCGCSTAAGVLDIGEWQTRQANLCEDPLAGDHSLEHMSAVSGFNGPGVDFGVGYCFE